MCFTMGCIAASVWLVTCRLMSLTCIVVVCFIEIFLIGYILVCLVACIILAGLISSIVHSCLIICVYAYVWMVKHCLCMFMVACGQVYSEVMMVVVMHEVVVCVVVEVMH